MKETKTRDLKKIIGTSYLNKVGSAAFSEEIMAANILFLYK